MTYFCKDSPAGLYREVERSVLGLCGCRVVWAGSQCGTSLTRCDLGPCNGRRRKRYVQDESLQKSSVWCAMGTGFTRLKLSFTHSHGVLGRYKATSVPARRATRQADDWRQEVRCRPNAHLCSSVFVISATFIKCVPVTTERICYVGKKQQELSVTNPTFYQFWTGQFCFEITLEIDSWKFKMVNGTKKETLASRRKLESVIELQRWPSAGRTGEARSQNGWRRETASRKTSEPGTEPLAAGTGDAVTNQWMREGEKNLCKC